MCSLLGSETWGAEKQIQTDSMGPTEYCIMEKAYLIKLHLYKAPDELIDTII